MANLTISVPSAVPPKPYTAPDSAFLPLLLARVRDGGPQRLEVRLGEAGARCSGRVMQKCSAGGSCRAIIRQPWAMSESLTR